MTYINNWPLLKNDSKHLTYVNKWLYKLLIVIDIWSLQLTGKINQVTATPFYHFFWIFLVSKSIISQQLIFSRISNRTLNRESQISSRKCPIPLECRVIAKTRGIPLWSENAAWKNVDVWKCLIQLSWKGNIIKKLGFGHAKLVK